MDYIYTVTFRYSGKKVNVSLTDLIENCIYFLENFCEEPVVSKSFRQIAGPGNGEERFRRFIEAAGYHDDPQGFFREILSQIEILNYRSAVPVMVNGIEIPYQHLIFILELLLPGNGIVDVKSVQQLEGLANIKYSQEEAEDIKEIIDTYPVRFSWHTIRQMILSWPVAFQYMPFSLELDSEGLENTWVGQFHNGIIEQMYVNRIIYILNMKCPVYCRFCFRKHKDCRNQKSPTKSAVKDALKYIKSNKDIKEVVLTGGDPFMNRSTMRAAVEDLLKIDHVQTLRLATRSISYFPNLFYNDNYFWFNFIKKASIEAAQLGRKIEIATHFVHPDEVSLYTLDIISDFVKAGIPVYIQTPLLNDCNNGGPELVKLFNMLRGAGAELHYIFMPCSPIKGNSVYRTSIKDGHDTVRYLRAHGSDRAFPHICTATSMGKIDWHSSGWAVEKDKNDENYIWIRTPYTAAYFQSFVPELELDATVRVNEEGTLDLKYMAEIGDESLLVGHRKKIYSENYFNSKIEKQNDGFEKRLEKVQIHSVETAIKSISIVPTGSKSLSRVHKTRVEIISGVDRELDYNLNYIGNNEDITDVVIVSEKDTISSLNEVIELIKVLSEFRHVNSIRLRSLKFLYSPETFSKYNLKRLARLNDLRIINPTRIEFETRILHASELTVSHRKIVSLLRSVGISIYNNTPLITGINDNPKALHDIAFICREYGIEFNHFYIAGLPVQEKFLKSKRFNLPEIIDMASFVREFGSGRELPRYIINTELGEVDFGLTSRTEGTDEKGNVRLKLLPYNLQYYKEMKPNFRFRDNVEVDEEGHPIVSVQGLKISGKNSLIF